MYLDQTDMLFEPLEMRKRTSDICEDTFSSLQRRKRSLFCLTLAELYCVTDEHDLNAVRLKHS